MKKIISSIMIIIMILLSFTNFAFATGQLEATIEITPSVTEVVAGDTVTFTFVTKNIVNAEYGKIYAIEGVIEYDENFFQLLDEGSMTVGSTGSFVSMTAVGEGGTNGTILLKVVDNPTGSGVVKFTGLVAADARMEDSETLGVATTANQEFTITIKDKGGAETPCEHTYGNYTDNGNGQHVTECTKCGEKHTAVHTYTDGACTVCGAKEPVGECEHENGSVTVIDNGDGTHSKVCEVCGEKFDTEKHTYENGVCTVCEAKEPVNDCEHTYGEYRNNTDGTHSAECTKCGEKHTEEHTYKDSECTKCKVMKTTEGSEVKDETVADEEYKKSGLSTMLVSGIAIIAVVAVVMYRKNKKYQDIK